MNWIKKTLSFLLLINLIACHNSVEKEASTSTKIKKTTIDTLLFTAKTDISYYLQFQNKPRLNSYFTFENVLKITQTNFWYAKDEAGKLQLKEKKLNKELYEFDSLHRLILHDTYRDDNELFLKHRYNYSDDNCLISSIESNETRVVIESINYFSKENLIVKKDLINGFGIKIGYSKLYYSPENRQLSETNYWTTASTKDSTIFTFDSTGRLSKKINYETTLTSPFENAPETANTYFYNKEGLLIKQIQYNPWGLTENYQDRLYLTSEFTYNENKLLTSIIHKDKNNNITENIQHAYKLNKQGNWIEQHTIINNKKNSVAKRTLVY